MTGDGRPSVGTEGNRVSPPRTQASSQSRAEFPGQHADETVVFKLRRHWLILVTRLIPTFILLFVMAGVGAGIGLVVPVAMPVWVALIVLFSLVPLGLGVWQFLDWENDHYILTDQRVLHIERVYFLFESREEANLGKIQDVTVKMPSFIANALYFGDVQIETAGTGGQINFNAIPKPRKAQRLIFKQAGLPEPGTDHEEEWEKSKGRARLLRPLETFTRMLYAITPQGGDVRVWRKHWYVLLGKVVRPLLVALLLLIVWIATLILELPASLQLAPEIIIKVIPVILFLLSVGWIIWVAIDWHNDLYVLTDTHVIDIEKRPFTMEFRREANLGMIQNVSYKQPGFIPKLLNFGNTELETAGTLGKFTFDSIPDPRGVQEEITRRLEEFRKRLGKPAPKTHEELEQTLHEILRRQYGMNPRGPGDQGRP